MRVLLPRASPENSSVPPDVTSATPQDRGSHVEMPPPVRGMSRGQSRSSMMDTADGTEPSPLTPDPHNQNTIFLMSSHLFVLLA